MVMMKTPSPSRAWAPGGAKPASVCSSATRVGVVAAVAAQRALGVVVGDDVGHRPVALRLHDQPAVELQAGADQGGQRAGLAQQVGDGVGIVVAGQDLVDDRSQPREAAAHGLVFDLERRDQVVEGHESLGHEADMGTDCDNV